MTEEDKKKMDPKPGVEEKEREMRKMMAKEIKKCLKDKKE